MDALSPVARPFAEAARTAAEALARLEGVSVAAVYLSDPRGGQVLFAAARSDMPGERLHPHLWWEPSQGEWLWGGDGYYRVHPFRQGDESGLALLGRWPAPEAGRRYLRHLQRAVAPVLAGLERALTSAREAAQDDLIRAEQAAYEAGAAIDATDTALLDAARLELDADAVRWDGAHLEVINPRQANPLSMATIEAWLRSRPPTGDVFLHRQITACALADVVDARSRDTLGHSQLVANLAVLAGAALGLAVSDLEVVESVARLQNVGMGFLGHQAARRARLDSNEREAIERHPLLGAALLAGAGFDAAVVDGVRHHHERFDGDGYPEGLSGASIPLSARIVHCADVYVALTHDRPWRPAMSGAEAADHLRRGARLQFDPEAVGAVMGAARSPLLAGR